MHAAGLIPTRFLTLTSHLVLLMTLFWSMKPNIEAGLSVNYVQADFDSKELQMYIALGLSTLFLVFELGGFFSGVSTFFPSQGLISIACHASASITISYFLFDLWPSSDFWYIFGVCSCLPFVTELGMFMAVFCCHKTI